MLQSKEKEIGGLNNLKDELVSHISNLKSENWGNIICKLKEL